MIDRADEQARELSWARLRVQPSTPTSAMLPAGREALSEARALEDPRGGRLCTRVSTCPVRGVRKQHGTLDQKVCVCNVLPALDQSLPWSRGLSVPKFSKE